MSSRPTPSDVAFANRQGDTRSLSHAQVMQQKSQQLVTEAQAQIAVALKEFRSGQMPEMSEVSDTQNTIVLSDSERQAVREFMRSRA